MFWYSLSRGWKELWKRNMTVFLSEKILLACCHLINKPWSHSSELSSSSRFAWAMLIYLCTANEGWIVSLLVGFRNHDNRKNRCQGKFLYSCIHRVATKNAKKSCKFLQKWKNKKKIKYNPGLFLFRTVLVALLVLLSVTTHFQLYLK